MWFFILTLTEQLSAPKSNWNVAVKQFQRWEYMAVLCFTRGQRWTAEDFQEWKNFPGVLKFNMFWNLIETGVYASTTERVFVYLCSCFTFEIAGRNLYDWCRLDHDKQDINALCIAAEYFDSVVFFFLFLFFTFPISFFYSLKVNRWHWSQWNSREEFCQLKFTNSQSFWTGIYGWKGQFHIT